MFFSDISTSFNDENMLQDELKNLYSKNQISYINLNYIPEGFNFSESQINYFIDSNSQNNLLTIKSGNYNKGKYNIYKINSDYSNNIKTLNVRYDNLNNYLYYSISLSQNSLDLEIKSPAYKILKINSKYFDEMYIREEKEMIKAYVVLPIEDSFNYYELDFNKKNSLKLAGEYKYKNLYLETSNISKEEFIKTLESIIYVY